MRKALIVGIDYYSKIGPLFGCVNDAKSVENSLCRNGDGSVNFDCKTICASTANNAVTRAGLKENIKQLFKDDVDIALFYFAGHGHIDTTGGYILPSDAERGDEGVSLADILILANESRAKNKIVLLDSCFSGIAGTLPGSAHLAHLAEGVTILTASTSEQYASEQNGRGVFTSLLVDALEGSAANLTGDITPGSIYAHIDQSLGTWEQRPVFKTNVKQFVSLKTVKAPIEITVLKRISEFFPSANGEYFLNPTFEPEMKGRSEGMPDPDPGNTKKFAVLQKFNRLNLLVPVGVPHMWDAAMQSKSCKLTALGEHYRRLAEKDRI